MVTKIKFVKFLEVQKCPDVCPECGEEGSVVDWGGECYCQACNYYL